MDHSKLSASTWLLLGLKQMISTFSRIKAKLFQLVHFDRYHKVLDRLLAYPHDLIQLEQYIRSLPRDVIQRLLYNPLKDTHYVDLIYRYRILNAMNSFNEGILVLAEIQLRESSKLSVFRGYGVRKFLLLTIMRCPQSKVYLALFQWLLRRMPGFDSTYGDAVRDKSVAVVGAAPYRSDQLVGIDKNDVVVRINTNNVLSSSMNIGSRVDVVYVRGERGQHISRAPNNYVEAEASQGIIYRFKIANHIPNQLRSRASTAISFDEIFDYGPLNAVQTAIFDLYIHGARRVYVYNVDFNLSAASQCGYRPPALPPVDYHKIFVSHPPHTNFMITKFFFQNGFLRGDSEFERLVSLDYEKFISLFSSVFAKFEIKV
jgi:hypothetical protein